MGGVVTDRKDLDTTIGSDGMQGNYLVLPAEERAKGFVRPVRTSYKHVGIAAPSSGLRDLTAEEQRRHPDYVKFEDYPPGGSAVGRFWSQEDLDEVNKGCGATTTMGRELAETYAREPKFYGSTFCVRCRKHLPVQEFVWASDGTRVGS